MFKHIFMVALAVALLACSPEDPRPQRQISDRLLEETSEVFSRNKLARWEEVFTWTFEEARDLEPWQQQGFDLVSKISKDQWILGASEDGAFIERSVSDTIDRLEVILAGTGQRPLQLQWAGPGETFLPRRSVEVRGEESTGRYVFDLAGHPHWRGEISRLRWVPRLRPKLRARLKSMRGMKSVAVPELRQVASQRPFKVTLGNVSRTARLVLPEAFLSKTVQVEDTQRLEVAFGLDREVSVDTEFRIEGVAEDGAVSTLFTDSVLAPRKPAVDQPTTDQQATANSLVGQSFLVGEWHEAAIDLAPWAGQSLELRFYVEQNAEQVEHDREAAYGFWGDLRLNRRRQISVDQELPPNVALVVIDTLRADHLSLYGYPRPTSPNLDRWAAEKALSFRSVVAASPWTFPSHVSLFTGLDTLSHGQHHPRSMPRRFDLLAQHLQRAGYETMAVTAGGYLDAHYGFARGFDRYFVTSRRQGPKGDLEEGLAQAREWTETAHRPYFLFLHTYEVHTPHRVRSPYYQQLSGRDGDAEQLARLTTRPLPEGDTAGAVRRKTYAWKDGQGGSVELGDGEVQEVVDAYDSAIAYTDHHLGSFLEELADHGDPQLVAITSDHGEALGEHQLADHAYLYDFNLEIPLIVALPDGRGAGQWVDSQVRQIDVAPTLLEALGLPIPPMDGTSLLPFFDNPTAARSAEDDMAWSATAYQGLSLRRGNRLKYVFNPTIWQRQEARDALFLLDRDPGEVNDVSARHQATGDLEKLTIARFMESFDGLLISLDNPTSEEIQMTLEGPEWLGPQFFKSVDAPSESMRFDKSRQFHVDIPPAGRFSLVVEQLTPGDAIQIHLAGEQGSCTVPLGVTASLDATSSLDATLSLDVLETSSGDDQILPRRFDRACQESAAGSSSIGSSSTESGSTASVDVFSLSLFYRYSTSNPETTDGTELPAELTDQLRALGYLD